MDVVDYSGPWVDPQKTQRFPKKKKKNIYTFLTKTIKHFVIHKK